VTSAVQPAEGLNVLHLFGKVHAPGSVAVDTDRLRSAVDKLAADGATVVPVAVLGHKADICLMAVHVDWVGLRRFQTEVARSGVTVVDSYTSVTELSEYAVDTPENERRLRLFPKLPPKDKHAWCFYPMSKRRNVGANWFSLSYEERRDLMREHGMSGRKFGGRIAQLITGSTGLDDYEWGVTLWGQHVDDLKAVVYTLRYDTGSAVYGEFGRFYVGVTDSLDEVLDQLGL
jgi:chlorite dismutase